MQIVLCAIDGSPHAAQALDLAATVAAATGATLHAVTVEHVPPMALLADVSPTVVDSFEDGFRALAAACRTAAEAAGAKKGVQVDFHELRHVAPGPGICELADQLNADLVVLGSRGHGAIASALLGSISAYVLHHLRRPVLVDRRPVVL